MPVRYPETRLEDEDRAGLPPVRAALVERARERVRLGFYDRADVTRALVEALLNDLALS
jgi:hypothetical protein